MRAFERHSDIGAATRVVTKFHAGDGEQDSAVSDVPCTKMRYAVGSAAGALRHATSCRSCLLQARGARGQTVTFVYDSSDVC